MSTLPRAPDFRVDGKRALVTGAIRGLGLAAAAALAQAGAVVTLAARSEPELRAACEQIGAAGGQCNFLVLDVTDSAAVDREIGARVPFQILVNNAGMSRPKELVGLACLEGFMARREYAPAGTPRGFSGPCLPSKRECLRCARGERRVAPLQQ